MKAAQRNGVIILMVIALGGIIAFQVYWIDTALTQSRTQFERNVQETLVQVADKLEEKEASDISAQTFVFFSDDEPSNVVVSPGDVDISIHRIGKDQTSAQALSYVIHTDSLVAIPKNEFVIKEKLEKRVKMVDIAVNRILNDEKTTIRDRIDEKELDSLLAKSLLEKGIRLNYEFGVFDTSESEKVILSNVESPSWEVKSSTYQASLFPNDIDGSSHFLSVYFPGQSAYLIRQIGTTLIAGIIFIGIILGCFIYTLRIISKQKKLSDIKNDFINNMTHELKTPIATISLATQVLSEKEVIGNKKAMMKYLSVIRDENSRLSHQVERVLQSALLENEELEIDQEDVSFHSLLGDVLETFKSVNQDVELHIRLEAVNDRLSIDIHHITNVINNLLDNAEKYSENGCRIDIKTTNQDESFNLHIRDYGIGMDPKQLSNIFESFYRIPTGNLHDVKGFGLGLSYVQHIVKMHNGEIDVSSTPGQGSEFIIRLQNAG